MKKKENLKKYRIDEILDQLPYADRKKKIRELVSKLSITMSYLWVIRNYKVKDRQSIPVDKLVIIADVLGTSTDYLLRREEIMTPKAG